LLAFKCAMENYFRTQLGKIIKLNYIGERRLIMVPNNIWRKWKSIFIKHEQGTLYDLDNGVGLRNMKNKNSKIITYKYVPIITSKLKSFMGLEMTSISECANKILMKPRPKIYLTKKPATYKFSRSIKNWNTQKKWKNIIIKEIEKLRIIHPNHKGNSPRIVVEDNINHVVWKEFKTANYVTGRHIDELIALADATFLKKQLNKKSRSKDVLPIAFIAFIQQLLDNKHRIATHSSQIIVREFSEDKFPSPYIVGFNVDGMSMEFNKQNKPKEENICGGLMDLREFPQLHDKLNYEYNRLNSVLKLWKDGDDGILSLVQIPIWMVILKKEQQKAFERLQKELFRDYTCKEAIYWWGEWESGRLFQPSTYTQVYFMKLKFNGKNPLYNGDGILGKNKLQKNFAVPEDARYKTEEEYKENNFAIHDQELRMETYLQFINAIGKEGNFFVNSFGSRKPVMAATVST
jgi:hypothetical protein